MNYSNMNEFKGTEYLCCCDKQEIIQSRYSGEYSQCSCGKCAVDQTPHYVRFIGAMLQEKEKSVDNNSSKHNT